MEDECIFFLGLIALVCGYTPTFRNEATHPLKAPTESTLGLQMNDESVGRTKSNPSKSEPYLAGGKHFEYLLLNDSSVLLTSLQNDNLDAAAAAENDTFSTKSNFLSPDSPKVTSSPRWQPNSLNEGWRRPKSDLSKSAEGAKQSRRLLEGVGRDMKFTSTTKLFSRQADKKCENFATFTSPLAANKMAAPLQPASKMASTPAVQKQSYDYDDSIVRLLVSNGILKLENKSVESAPQNGGSVGSARPAQDANPSAEDVSRIMDAAVGHTRNESITRILKSSSKPEVDIETTSSLHKSEALQQTDISTQQVVNSTSKMDEPVPENSALLTTHPSIHKLGSSATTIDHTTNSSDADLKVHSGLLGFNSEIGASSLLLEEQTTTILDFNFSSPSEAPITIDTSLSTSTPADKPTIHLEKRLIRNYETTSQAKPLSSGEFVHTDQSNENPLSAKAYTDLVPNVESETEFPFGSQPLLQSEDLDSSLPVPSGLMIDNRRLVKRQPSTSKPRKPLQPQALTREQHILSVSEFKELVEKCIRHLFYFVARFIREQNLLSPEMLLQNPNNRVTLKRFGFSSIRRIFNSTAQEVSNCWRDVADSSYRKADIPLDQLFEDNDNENARWIVFTSTDNTTYERLQRGIVAAADYTLVARLSLEYCGLKINAIIALPSTVATNVSLPESDESSIDVNEELLIEEPSMSAVSMQLELGPGRYRVLQLFSRYPQADMQTSKEVSWNYQYQHEDLEFHIFVLGGAVCIFSILSPILYGIFRLIHSHRMRSTASSSFRLPSIFRRGGDKFLYQQSHQKMPESRCESLNVIFSEEFDKKYSSWFDNTYHSSSILKASADGGSTSGGLYNDDSLDDYPEFSDLTRNVCENNSPRLSKENRLNMGCRPACVLLPHPATYLMQSEKEERYFDNPNYSR